jgi:rhamnosyltransferase
MKVLLCIPVLNVGDKAEKLVSLIAGQTRPPDECLIVDSGSSDESAAVFRAAGLKVLGIPPSEFNHGRTRQMCVNMASDAGIIIFLTQDAFFVDQVALERLIHSFEDEKVGAAYGRQLPRNGASLVEAHARHFNYPPESRIKAASDIPLLGIKTAFLSNSFAAYRRTALKEVGGFPDDVIMGEDVCVAAKMILSGWKIAYCADASVFHSHNYTISQEFGRYFDIGVFHRREGWLIREFGRAEGEGMRYLKSEIAHLLRKKRYGLLPASLLRTVAKYLGYLLGSNYEKVPAGVIRKVSMHREWWEKAGN